MVSCRTKPDLWWIPHIKEIFDELHGCGVFTCLDQFSGYWQIKMDEPCKEYITLVSRIGTFRFEGMPFGLINVPSTFLNMMD